MKRAVLFLADGFEEIEGLAVVDLLRRADIPVDMISIMGRRMVTGSHGISVEADCLYEEWSVKDTDMLVLPGGPGTENLRNHEGLISLIKKFFSEGKMLAAICAAPSIFGMCGILHGIKATSFPTFRDQLEGAVVLDEKVVRDKNVITSKGMGTSLDFGLELIAYWRDRQEADRISELIQYEK